jgi:hypothetical protein
VTKDRKTQGQEARQLQLPFAAFDAIRAARTRRRDELVANCVGLSPTQKRLLQALHARCGGGKQFCWPSRRVIAADLGYVWPGCERTITRQITTLKALGLLLTQEGQRRDGGQSSTVYCIRYCLLRRMQAEGRGFSKDLHRVRGGSEHLPPRQYCLPPSSLLTTPPRHQCLPPSTVVPGDELNGMEVEVNRTPYVCTETAKPVAASRQSAGETTSLGPHSGEMRLRTDGGGLMISEKKSGWWAYRIEREDLSDKSEMVGLYEAAVKAAIVTNTVTNRVRFVALMLHVKSQANIHNVTGYIVTTIERGSWNCLPKSVVLAAAKLVGGEALRLSAAQLQEAGTNSPPKSEEA